MSQAPPLVALNKRRKVGTIFQAVLSLHRLSAAFDDSTIHIRPKAITELTSSKTLSNAVLNYMFPREPTPADLIHYTTIPVLRSMVASQELRLYALRKRICQGELDTFAKRHNLTRYLDTSKGAAFYRELSEDIFYTSFTRPSAVNEDEMWNIFAAQGTGVRLAFRLLPRVAELRSIQYEQSSRTLLNQLNDALAADLSPRLRHGRSRRSAPFIRPAGSTPKMRFGFSSSGAPV